MIGDYSKAERAALDKWSDVIAEAQNIMYLERQRGVDAVVLTAPGRPAEPIPEKPTANDELYKVANDVIAEAKKLTKQGWVINIACLK